MFRSLDLLWVGCALFVTIYIYIPSLFFVTWWGWGTADAERAHILFIRAYL